MKSKGEESKAKHETNIQELSLQHHQYFPESLDNLRVLIIRKPHNSAAQKVFLEATEQGILIGIRILLSHDIDIYLEKEVIPSVPQKYQTSHINTLGNLDLINFVIVIGGDGTLLWASRIFRKKFKIPPILTFAVGSLGYLCQFEKTTLRSTLNKLFEQITTKGAIMHFNFQKKMRLYCSLFDKQGDIKKRIVKGSAPEPGDQEQQEEEKLEGLHALNQITIDRGSQSSLCLLNCEIDGEELTTVQADGIMISTPTGSTAYNLAAGGPLVSTNVDAILFTPICPHSLSFKPVIFPVSSQIAIKVPKYARSEAWISLDGHTRHRLAKEDVVRIQKSMNPLVILAPVESNQLHAWCQRLRALLHWNTRGAVQGITDSKL